ncbi:transposase [Deinococcus hopiensis]|uniref:transposase n=1 Tax=Deinococcus hopiensis TaxID=309885 RepID=UPI003CCBEC3B
MLVSTPWKESGRPRRDARQIFNGSVWLAWTGGQWSQLPRRHGPASTVHQRLCAWGERERFRAVWAIIPEEDDQALGTDRERGKPPTGRKRAPNCLVRPHTVTRRRRALREPGRSRRAALRDLPVLRRTAGRITCRGLGAHPLGRRTAVTPPPGALLHPRWGQQARAPLFYRHGVSFMSELRL